jgi:CheY-like chemotaxis protein
MKNSALLGKKILIAEDNDANILLMTSLMEIWGIECGVAVDGDEAVSMARAIAYDAVLMDIHMPKQNGINAVRKIREFSKVPVIAITASMSTVDLRGAMGAGVNDYIIKPVKSAHLFELLKKYIGIANEGII